MPRLAGFKHSEETKRKISENNARHWLGKHHLEETKQKISTSKKGVKMSLRAKKNMSEARKKEWAEGKRNREAVRNMAKRFDNSGSKRSEEVKEKMSKVAKEKGFGQWMMGKKLSKETKEKMSKVKSGKLPKNIKLFTEKGKATRLKRGIRQKKLLALSLKKQAISKGPTSIEKKLYEELKTRGLLFEKQRLINGRFLVDAYIPNLNLVIEADGDYWHSLPKSIEKDKIKNTYLLERGYNLLRLTGTEINNGSFKKKLSICMAN